MIEGGSTANGTGIPGGEDDDQLGVVVDLPNEVLGLNDALPHGHAVHPA